MMGYDFNEKINRRNTSSWKWSQINSDDGIAAGLADMDFRTPDVVVDEIKKIADFGLYGYVFPGEGYYTSFIEWSKRRYRWEIDETWLSYTPGVIAALGGAVRAFSNVGDQVIFQTPGFKLFTELIETNAREPVHNPMIYLDGKYTIDFTDLEKKAQNPKAKIFLICNPQNPSCRVFTKEELLRIGEICLKNNLIILSDEVHCDLVYKPNKHIPIASLSEELANNTVTCFSPTKTFNMAGLQVSVNVIPNPEMQTKYALELRSRDSLRPNIFAMHGMRAAYSKGEPWLEELLPYVKGNVEFLTTYISDNIPELKVVKPEGTYLIWVDCSELGISGPELGDFFLEMSNIYVTPGSIYGEVGRNFIRINLACPRSVLEEILKRMEKAIRDFMGGKEL